jgi:ABC-type multidrug transport system permease subunit
MKPDRAISWVVLLIAILVVLYFGTLLLETWGVIG